MLGVFFFLFFFQAVFAQLYVSPGTHFTVGENTTIYSKEEEEKNTENLRDDDAILFVSEDAIVANLGELHIAKPKKESTKLLAKAVKSKKSVSVNATKKIAKKVSTKVPQKIEYFVSSSDAANRFFQIVSKKSATVHLNESYYKVVAVFQKEKSSINFSEFLYKTSNYDEISLSIETPFSTSNFTRPPPYA